MWENGADFYKFKNSVNILESILQWALKKELLPLDQDKKIAEFSPAHHMSIEW